MHPRQFIFALVGAVIGGIVGYLGAAALHQTLVGGAVIIGVVGIAVGIGIGRYLGRVARLREAGRALPELDEDTGQPKEMAP